MSVTRNHLIRVLKVEYGVKKKGEHGFVSSMSLPCIKGWSVAWSPQRNEDVKIAFTLGARPEHPRYLVCKSYINPNSNLSAGYSLFRCWHHARWESFRWLNWDSYIILVFEMSLTNKGALVWWKTIFRGNLLSVIFNGKCK